MTVRLFIALLLLPSAFCCCATESDPVPDTVTVPQAPLTIDLLQLHRGKWEFRQILGQRLTLPYPAPLYAFPARQGGDRIGVLLLDPEFPDGSKNAKFRIYPLSEKENTAAIDETVFRARLKVESGDSGDAVRAELQELYLGDLKDRIEYVGGIFLSDGDSWTPFWAAPPSKRFPPRLIHSEVGGVFAGSEPIRLTLATHSPVPMRFTVTIRDYASGKSVWNDTLTISGGQNLQMTEISVPLTRYGIFQVIAQTPGAPKAECRITRIPEPQQLTPESSSLGMNIFQQQVWYYAYQLPLLAKAGVRWIRPWLNWENTWLYQQPSPDQWRTGPLDSALRRMDQFGQDYQYIIFWAPAWVAGDVLYGTPPPDKLDQLDLYLDRLTRQFGSRIKYWELWNEPDCMWRRIPVEQQVKEYVEFMRVASNRIRANVPDAIIAGISFSGVIRWLDKLVELGPSEYFDIATLHSYVRPFDFRRTLKQQMDILRRDGISSERIWMNEIGVSAYDFNPEYNRKVGTSELFQAEMFTWLYAQSLSLNPDMKFFWFCSYDPRNPNIENALWDATTGVTYMGSLPKLSYAAMAAAGAMIDGRKAMGFRRLSKDVEAVPFEGGVVVLRQENKERISATGIGFDPESQIEVKDIFGNPLFSGKASDAVLDFRLGVLYVCNADSFNTKIAADSLTERILNDGFYLPFENVRLPPGERTQIPVALPEGFGPPRLETEPGLAVNARYEDGKLIVSAPKNAKPQCGGIRLILEKDGKKAIRLLKININSAEIIPDGGFWGTELDRLYFQEFSSNYRIDHTIGANAPGSLRIDAPFAQRLGIRGPMTELKSNSVPIRFRAKVKAERFTDSTFTIQFAMFDAKGKWLKTYIIARIGQDGKTNSTLMDFTVKIPGGSFNWKAIDVTLPAELLDPRTMTYAFFIDATPGKSGKIWLDDLSVTPVL